MNKKLISVVISIFISINLFFPVKAFEANNVSVDDVDNAMLAVSNSLKALDETKSLAETNTLASFFTSFMDIARTTGTLVTAVNGSITFLRLLGIVTDPTQSKLDGITQQLVVIDEKLDSMDNKLNQITQAMAQIQASVEFNSRTEKAILYNQNWRDFEYRYMENGLNELMTSYSEMVKNGLLNWCNGTRNVNGVDTSKITVLYIKDGSNYKIVYSDENSIPVSITAEDRWISIPASCLPETFSYNVNTFNENLESAIAGLLTSTIGSESITTITTQNYPALNTLDETDINNLAKDIVNTLIYRVASSKVNGTEGFAGKVSDAFTNYCSHLQSASDGIDATLKTLYLTHAFEYQVSKDISDFLDRMIILTGTYGAFVSNVLGMSKTTEDTNKLAVLNQMTAAIKMIQDAKRNGITGQANYCYITGSVLKYSTITFKAAAEIEGTYNYSKRTYESCKGTNPSATLNNAETGSVPMGDAAMIVLANTLLSNGVTFDHNYLNEKLGENSITEYGKLVTGYSSTQTLPFDGKTNMHVRKCFGDYFTDKSVINKLTGDEELEYAVFRKKISGSLYDLSTKSLTTNETLCAIAAYGESHILWSVDEAALMGGPYDTTSFTDEFEVTEISSGVFGITKKHAYKMTKIYNTIISSPLEVLTSPADSYNPISSLHNDVPSYVYNQNDYEEKIPYVEDDEPLEKVEEKKVVVRVKKQEEIEEEIIEDIEEPIEEEPEVIDVVDNEEPTNEEEKKELPFIPIVVVGGIIVTSVLIYVLRKKKN